MKMGRQVHSHKVVTGHSSNEILTGHLCRKCEKICKIYVQFQGYIKQFIYALWSNFEWIEGVLDNLSKPCRCASPNASRERCSSCSLAQKF